MPTVTTNHTSRDELIRMVAEQNHASPDEIIIYADSTAFMAELLLAFAGDRSLLVVAGHATAELEISADRADMKVVELFGKSPFNGDTQVCLEATPVGNELLYVGNPNRITGCSYSTRDLARMAEMVPDGMLLVDEYYLDHLGITVQPLIETNRNLIIIRGLAPTLTRGAVDAGYIFSQRENIDHIRSQVKGHPLSMAMHARLLNAMADEDQLTARIKEVHEESLRLATELSRRGVQSRITATDYLLLRVMDPTAVGNELARHRVPVENLTGYPGLKKYLRYRIESPESNDRMLAAFRQMPAELYKMKSPDLRSQKLHVNRSSRGRSRFSEGRPVIKSTGKTRSIQARLMGRRETAPGLKKES